MESSEDDAGAASNASRRALARETEPERAEAMDACAAEPAGAGGSCGTPATSEENYDGDSVPSPSAHDANTSTEAILDMIDDFIDGPREPREPPRDPDPPPAGPATPASTDHTEETTDNLSVLQQQTNKSECDVILPEVLIPPPVHSAKSETLLESSTEPESQLSTPCEVPVDTGVAAQCSEPVASSEIEPLPVPEQSHPMDTVSEEVVSVGQVEESAYVHQQSLPTQSEDVIVPESHNQPPSVEHSEPSATLEQSEQILAVGKSELPSPLEQCDLPAPTIECAIPLVPESSVLSPVADKCELSETIGQSDLQSMAGQSELSCVDPSVLPPLIGQSESPSPTEHNELLPANQSDVPSSAEQDNLSSASIQIKSTEQIDEQSKVDQSELPTTPEQSEEHSLAETSDLPPTTSQSELLSVTEPTESTAKPVDAPSSELQNEQLSSAVESDFPTCMDGELHSASNTASCESPAPTVQSENAPLEVQSELPTSAVPTQQPQCEPELSAPPIVEPEQQPVSSVETDMLSSCPVPSSSISDSLDTSECQVQDRTVKCVSSSESNDNVTVGSVESTSSDIIASTPVTRSPLKRRLVRPARPDTTVSSSVDLQPTVTQTTQPTTSECIVKDVSSSSDAVSSIEDVCATRITGNVSEISVCKAETSTAVSTPKKIKLIRNKIPAPVTQTVQITPEPQPCQSTSLPDASLSESRSESCFVNCISTTESTHTTVDEETVKDSNTTENTVSEIIINETPKEEPTIEPPEEKLEAKELNEVKHENEVETRKVPPIKLSLSGTCNSEHVVPEEQLDDVKSLPEKSDNIETAKECTETVKQVPKLTIKIGSAGKIPEEMKSPIPKVTIKPLRPPVDDKQSENCEQFPSITKLNIKPIPKPPEKINDIHRKSSSSDISDTSESSENDETSTSDQASASDQGPSDVIPKVTIKLGKPGTQSEGKFYTEKSIPKLTIKPLQNEEHVDIQSEERQYEKIPKLTIKPVTRSDSQPLSPKLTIKPLKPPPESNLCKEINMDQSEIPKLKINQESLSPREIKENSHVPKITIKPITKPDTEATSPKSTKKLSSKCEDDHIPVVTKLNIKPVVKPTERSGESSDSFDDKVPVVSKLNIKPIVKPKDNDIDSNLEDIPKVTKINIKPIKNPEENISEDCDDWNTCGDAKSIPIVSKLNIKPIVKPVDEDASKESENQSSETGNSSDDNTDQIPVVTKLNIKPIVKPNDSNDSSHSKSNALIEDNIPVVTKLNIKPIIKPGDDVLPSSPKKEKSSDYRNADTVPVVTKLNIKPIVKPEDMELQQRESEEATNPPIVMKINIKSMTESYDKVESKAKVNENHTDEIPVVSKINIKPIVKPIDVYDEVKAVGSPKKQNCHPKPDTSCSEETIGSTNTESCEIEKQNCVSESLEIRPVKGLNSVVNMVKSSSPVPITRASENIEKSIKANIHNEERKSKDVVTEASKRQAIEQLSQITRKSSTQTCTLLKKLLEETTVTKVENITNAQSSVETNKTSTENNIAVVNCAKSSPQISEKLVNSDKMGNDLQHDPKEELSEQVTKPLEINTVSDKVTSSGQDSPRIILKINKTEHGASSEIINLTDEVKPCEKSQSTQTMKSFANHQKAHLNSKKKTEPEEVSNAVGKRLRSSRVVQEQEKTPTPRRLTGKRGTPLSASSDNKETEMTALESKRVKLGKLLMNKALTITPVTNDMATITPIVKVPSVSPPNPKEKVNNSILNNENCSKNGNSKLHKILSNLQAKQAMQVMPTINCLDNRSKIVPEHDSTNTSTGSSDVVEVPLPVDQQVIMLDSPSSRDFSLAPDDVAQDPLDVDSCKEVSKQIVPEVMTPQPKKRGRPRKVPASEGAKPAPPPLPTPALEERPQRSLRLSR